MLPLQRRRDVPSGRQQGSVAAEPRHRQRLQMRATPPRILRRDRTASRLPRRLHSPPVSRPLRTPPNLRR